MSSWLPVRWLQSAWWLKVTTLAVAMGLAHGALWLLWLRPVQQESLHLELRIRKESASYQATLRPLLARPSLSVLEEEIHTFDRDPHASTSEQAFSLLLAAYSNDVERWLPDKQGGRLTLALSWADFTRLLDDFSALAAPPGIVGFELRRDKPEQPLHLELHYEK